MNLNDIYKDLTHLKRMLRNFENIKAIAETGNYLAIGIINDIQNVVLFSKKITHKEKMVIKYYLLLDKSRSEVASLLGVSEVHISRLTAQAIEKIQRELLNDTDIVRGNE
jgi:DNA-directed RNA polymerase specialized sigma subunit